MVRTQIQLPDALYARVKRVAEQREISLAELVRRGLEAILDQLPAHPAGAGAWSLPVARVGHVKVPLGDLRQYSADDEADARMVAEDDSDK